ncbi:glycosyltransferase family 9 protein [Desulfohalobiaceae bacterium Ax17]|uniref:glycosyltransferase family 9 protein n=1 Tax=Desulfovulcanus ferrireducens TaxID=2831190 RepID=UPI00207BAE80|nr:glycosyltransferase family 9 protein [Desulfovulcanus ferrireducens]MBT8762935.1 glycosyltransferase family 9 protein [Desulfovulcanus ferrireducens]
MSSKKTSATAQKSINLDHIYKILVCQLRQIGDVLLTTPSVELLKKRFPEAQIHFLTEKKCLPVLENNPHISKIWVIDKKKTNNLWKELKFYRQIAWKNFDLIVDFQQLPRCRWVVLFSRSKVKLTYPPPWYNRLLYTHWQKPEPGYAARFKASILKPLGISWQGNRPKIWLKEAELDRAKNFLAGQGVTKKNLLITIDPSHRRITRRWPAGHFAQLIHQASQKWPNIKFLLLYGPGEKELALRILSQSQAEDFCILPEKMLSLREMAACIAHANLHLGNCSAPRHIAVAVNTPSLTILGATSGAWTYPSAEHEHIQLGLSCQPCNQNTCANPRCLEDLKPEVVLKALEKKLENLVP